VREKIAAPIAKCHAATTSERAIKLGEQVERGFCCTDVAKVTF